MKRRPHPLATALALGAVALLVAVAAGCSRLRSGTFPKAPVIFISIDTLRADRLPAYGYTKVETPALESFRKEAILFENAYSHVPLTLPSHASILTGVLPAAHGIHDNLGYSLSPKVETLQETLKKAGYATGGAVSAIVLTSRSGIARGFDFYDDAVEPTAPNQVLGRVQRPGGETAAALEKWLDGVTGGPFFAFFHIYEPHSPYEPPEPFKSRYPDPYDGEVATADDIVGKFLDHLKADGVYDKAIIAIFSDHGEGLGDHQEDEHGIFLYRESIQVPLLLRLPGGRRGGERISGTAGLFDLAPTVLSLLGLPVPKVATEGVPLLSLTGQEAPSRRIYSETFYPRIHYGWSELSSLTSSRHSYIEAPRPEFYDLAADPKELKNLAEQKPAEFRSFRIDIEKLSQAFVKPAAVDKEEAAKLAALGYISAGGLAEGDLPDAKDMIGTMGEIRAAFKLFVAGKNEEAARAFKKLLDVNPRMMDIWDAYSQALYRQGRTDEALAALRTGMGHSPGAAPGFLVSVASLYLQLGKVDEALKHAELGREKGDPMADDVLARVYLLKKDLPRAEECARRALATAGVRRLPYLTLARIEMAKGNLPGALAHIEEAEQKTAARNLSPIMSLHQIKGDILGRMNRPKEAEAEFVTELRLFPSNLDSYASLALLYASAGQMADAREVLGRLLSASPTHNGYQIATRVLTVLGDRKGAADLQRQERIRLGETGSPRASR